MPGVVGGVSPRALAAGQAPIQYPDLLSASTTLLQSGGGGFARLVNALQSLDQSGNIVSVAGQVSTNTSDIATLQTQVANINTALGTMSGQITTLQINVTALQGQVSTLQGQVSTLQGQVSTLQGQVAAQQTVINSFNYLQAEVSTGTIYLDTRTIYKRSFVINSALETALTVFTFPHGIPALSYIVDIQAVAGPAGSGLQMLPITFLNMATAPSLSAGLSIWADPTNIYISVGSTTFPGTQVLATLWYTATNR